MKAEEILKKYSHDLLGALRELSGYYVCPKDASGKRLGPLVGYAGKDKKGRQYVGDVYANFAKMEEYPYILRHFASWFLNKYYRPDDRLVFCGAPLGGMAIATILADIFKVRYVFLEKKITALATEHQREQSELIFKRHSISRGDRVVLVEDVANNFSTTDKSIDLIEGNKAEVVSIACFYNRSLTVGTVFRGRPVDSLVRQPVAEWEQDDPEVAEDIAKGNVIWKPKDHWPKLEQAMREHSQQ